MKPADFITEAAIIAALSLGLYHSVIATAAAVLVCIFLFLETAALFSERFTQAMVNRSLAAVLARTAGSAVIIALLIAHGWGIAAGAQIFFVIADTCSWLAAREKKS